MGYELIKSDLREFINKETQQGNSIRLMNVYPIQQKYCATCGDELSIEFDELRCIWCDLM